MRDLRGLTVILADDEPDRFDVAVALAAACVALGGRARIYLHDRAVRLLAARDLSVVHDHDVLLVACQTGLAAAGIDHATLDQRVEVGGLVSLLADLGDDRLVTL